MKEVNWLDPEVLHDPAKSAQNIAMPLFSESIGFEPNEYGVVNPYASSDSLKIDGICYPLIVINDRNIPKIDILYMHLSFTNFLPEIVVKIKDRHQNETKINTTGMMGYIRICIISPVDKTYKKILMHFRIFNVSINNSNDVVTYYGTYDADTLRQVNTGHIWMESVCSATKCQKGGNIKANTWEMLHKISSLTGLGFAATKQTKEVEDRLIRNIHTTRFSEFIKQQLEFSGTDEDNILDAWIDPYNYIVLVNIPWILKQNIEENELTIIANVGVDGTSQGIGKSEPTTVPRIFTNLNKMPLNSNMFIKSYKLVSDNDAIYKGTLERIYTINWEGTYTKLDTLEIQTKQNSVDGEHLEEYNTGANRPIPHFNFNEDGYDLQTQKAIRSHFFRKKRQSLLKVTLENVNLGIQRGTLIGIQIYEQDTFNKQIMLSQASNILGSNDVKPDDIDVEYKESLNLSESEGEQVLNLKLTDWYYVDGIEFEYDTNAGKIYQTLTLFCKGQNSGYNNLHTVPKFKINSKN